MPQFNVGKLASNPFLQKDASIPTRTDSVASTNSSAGSSYSTLPSGYSPGRNGIATSVASSNHTYVPHRRISGHKRGLSDTIDIYEQPTELRSDDAASPSDSAYRSVRQQLRPLPQPPSKLSRASTYERTSTPIQGSPDPFPQQQSENGLPELSKARFSSPGPDSRPQTPIVQLHHPVVSPAGSSFVAPDVSELKKSTTTHLRALSRFAQSEDSSDFSVTAKGPSVIGLHNRRQLKRSDSRNGTTAAKRYGFGERNWMEKQRQFLAAYEYLCHIGEAKEWIEDVIHQSLPPIVELEEALRNGITLAEIVQAFHPEQTLRIFKHERLQFKHSDNIVLFFRFLEEVGLPELFRFELIDLYEKKNIPKVIYCIHALSWLLYRKGMVDFRIGNLVGQLQFQDHELEQTQKGLDKAGVAMPSFAGMGASFGAEPEPEPEPVESEEERIDRELHESETIIGDFQSQIRGALQRIQLGNTMQGLWNHEDKLVELQSILRAGWSREIAHYRLGRERQAVKLQAVARGFLVRKKETQRQQFWQSKQDQVLRIQSLFRAQRARQQVKTLKVEARTHVEGIKSFQAAIRGALHRQAATKQVTVVQKAEKEIKSFQSAIRGMLARDAVSRQYNSLISHESTICSLQTAIRGMATRDEIGQRLHRLESEVSGIVALQSAIRGTYVRLQNKRTQKDLRNHGSNLARIQAHIRGQLARDGHRQLILELSLHNEPTTELQKCIRGFLSRRRLIIQYNALLRHENMTVLLQANVRGLLSRAATGQMLVDLGRHQPEIVEIQAAIRATLIRARVGDLLSDLDEHDEAITQLQAFIRARRVCAKFAEQKRFFEENMKKVIKIQSVVRAKIQGQAYKSLTSGKNPPVGTLKGFVHLLNDSDFDFEEEIEFERLRKTAVQHVRQNELADQYIQQLDIKIALLVKNKITLDEVVKHQKGFGGLLPGTQDAVSKESLDLKALNRQSRRKLEHYQELFFLLQTQPQYLSKLFCQIRARATAEKECERIKHLVLGLFGYAQKRREEYYLLKLIVRSVKEEIELSEDVEDYLRKSIFANRIFSAYTRSPRDRKFHKDVLGQLVKQHFVDNVNLNLESDPQQIYLSAISNEELRTGRRSQRDPNVPREQAIRDPETRATFITHMQDLRDITDQFFLALEDCLHRLPFGVRYVIQQMYEALAERFAKEDDDFILQIVGQWAWRTYLQPALVDPEKSGVSDRIMTQEQKKNLGEVAKVLNQASTGRDFGPDNVYLQPLNNYIKESSQRFSAIWHHAMQIPSAEHQYDIDEFNDLYAKTKPTLYVKLADLFSIHQIVANDISSMAPNPDDILRDTLRELGSVKSNEADLGHVSSGEIMLTLTPKYLDNTDPDADIKALFTETKRCVLYIIRIQAGSSLLDILVKPVTLEDEDKWSLLIDNELSSTSKKRGAYSDLTNTLDFSTLSYPQLKQIALENILQLETLGRLTRQNQYQDLLNAIAIDIRTKSRRRIQRQRELEGVKTTLVRLDEQSKYLDIQLQTYNSYIEQAMTTLHSKTKRKKFLLPFTKQWDHERDLQKSGRTFKFGSYKYSARSLADKGVMVHWRGYTEQQWFRVDVTLSSNEVGVFTVEGSSGNMHVPGATATVTLDELLGAQFENRPHLEFFEGGALRCNVSLFLHLVMRKFYNE